MSFAFLLAFPLSFHLDQIFERADDANGVLCSLFRRDWGIATDGKWNREFVLPPLRFSPRCFSFQYVIVQFFPYERTLLI